MASYLSRLAGTLQASFAVGGALWKYASSRFEARDKADANDLPVKVQYLAVAEQGSAPSVASGEGVFYFDTDGKPRAKGDAGDGWDLVAAMVGATAGSAGAAGLVPAPAAGDQDKALLGSGLWGNVSMPFESCFAARDTDQTFTGSAYIVFTSTEWDTGDMADIGGSNPERVTVAGDGKYLVLGAYYFNGPYTVSPRLSIYVNGSAVASCPAVGEASGLGAGIGATVFAALDLEADDYIALYLNPGSSNSRNFRGHLLVHRLNA